jgi:hypothetical protein
MTDRLHSRRVRDNFMEEEVTQFNNVFDFSGSYRGSYDGRDARVTIQEGAAGVRSPNTLFTVTFTDIQRNEIYQGIASVPEGVLDIHVLSDFTLDRSGGGGSIYWSRLYLHTWDISYMSGVSLWADTEYGMSYRRD